MEAVAVAAVGEATEAGAATQAGAATASNVYEVPHPVLIRKAAGNEAGVSGGGQREGEEKGTEKGTEGEGGTGGDAGEGGFVYQDGFPTDLPTSLVAEQLQIPTFEGQAPRALRVSPQARGYLLLPTHYFYSLRALRVSPHGRSVCQSVSLPVSPRSVSQSITRSVC